MKKYPRRDIPPALAEEYDDYVVDAVALANGTLSPEREAEVRARMASDSAYRDVISPILEAKRNPVPVPAGGMDAQWADFRRRAGLANEEDDLTAFQRRVQSRDRATRHRMYLVAAIVVALIGIPVARVTYMSRSAFERVQTASNVTSRIDLPDGSVATLAPSSKLEYRTGMVTPQGNLNREVTLRGSADFAVTNQAERQFVVMTPHAHVIVVGTRFRVETRESFTLVSVQEGVVRAQAIDDAGAGVGTPRMLQAGASARIFSDGIVATEGQVIPPIRRSTP